MAESTLESPVRLLDRVARGDREAFGRFYDRYAGFVFSFALRILRNRTDAEDLTQTDIVQRLDLPLGTVKTRIRAAPPMALEAFDQFAVSIEDEIGAASPQGPVVLSGALALILFFASPVFAADAPQELPGGWKLIWHDEFDGTSLDGSKWTAEEAALIKNHEAQYYSRKYVTVQDGFLTMKSDKVAQGGREYTSGLIQTQGKFARAFGRFEIRAKLPKGKGIWPAHWMMPDDGSWPPEIDIMELLGDRPKQIYMTNHYDSETGPRHKGNAYAGPDFSEDFHIFAMEWESDEIRWYVDGELRYSTKDNVPNVPFQIILNTAVGGEWPGYPNKRTEFPQAHVVDYVRVYVRDPKNLQFVD